MEPRADWGTRGERGVSLARRCGMGDEMSDKGSGTDMDVRERVRMSTAASIVLERLLRCMRGADGGVFTEKTKEKPQKKRAEFK